MQELSSSAPGCTGDDGVCTTQGENLTRGTQTDQVSTVRIRTHWCTSACRVFDRNRLVIMSAIHIQFANSQDTGQTVGCLKGMGCKLELPLTITLIFEIFAQSAWVEHVIQCMFKQSVADKKSVHGRDEWVKF